MCLGRALAEMLCSCQILPLVTKLMPEEGYGENKACVLKDHSRATQQYNKLQLILMFA